MGSVRLELKTQERSEQSLLVPELDAVVYWRNQPSLVVPRIAAVVYMSALNFKTFQTLFKGNFKT